MDLLRASWGRRDLSFARRLQVLLAQEFAGMHHNFGLSKGDTTTERAGMG